MGVHICKQKSDHFRFFDLQENTYWIVIVQRKNRLKTITVINNYYTTQEKL